MTRLSFGIGDFIATLKGEAEGHPFRGNQYGDSGASGEGQETDHRKVYLSLSSGERSVLDSAANHKNGEKITDRNKPHVDKLSDSGLVSIKKDRAVITDTGRKTSDAYWNRLSSSSSQAFSKIAGELSKVTDSRLTGGNQ